MAKDDLFDDPIMDAESIDLEQLKQLIGEETTESDFQTESEKESISAKPAKKSAALMPQLLTILQKNKKAVLIGLCAIVLVLAGIGGYTLIRDLLDPYDCRILENITISGIPVGGMTRSEAKAAVRQATENTFTKEDMIVELPDATLRLSPADTQAKLNVNTVVKAAYRVGRIGSKEQRQADCENALTNGYTVDLLPFLRLKEARIREALEGYAQQYNLAYSEPSYTMEGSVPPLEAEKHDDSLPGQILKLTLGTPQQELDVDTVLQQILDTYNQNQFRLQIAEIPSQEVPPAPDLKAIWEEYYIAPVDATVSFETYQPVPGDYGYGFDLAKAQKAVDAAPWGQTVFIPMEYIEPEIMEDEVFFRDILGTCETKHTDDENRNTNLRLVCETLNGYIIQPGEEFSYNTAVGERTAEKGYKPAGAYSGTDLVQSIGGGVCQGSTTLYYCTLLADLEIVNRINHGYAVSYIEKGLDATVSWYGPDFIFKNNTHFPIQIQSEMSDGYMKMKLLGTDEKDYYVKMESQIVGYEPGAMYVRSYKCKYDKQTDELISRDMEARSTYIYYGAY